MGLKPRKSAGNSSFPFSDTQLVRMASQFGSEHGEMSRGSIAEGDKLADVADDSWSHAGWMEFENHPDLEKHQDEWFDKEQRLGLCGLYIAAFVKAVS